MKKYFVLIITASVIVLLLTIPIKLFSQKENYIDNYFLTGSKKNSQDTTALLNAQNNAKQTIGILEKEIDPKEYILGPEDEFTISIIASKSIQFDATISPEGKLLIRDIGLVNLKGKTLADAYEIIKQSIQKVYKVQDIFIVLKKLREFKVVVSGAVLKSNVVTATAVDRVSEVLERAGGLKHNASIRNIIIQRNGIKDNIKVDLLRFYMLNDNASNPTVLGGDHIYVPISNANDYLGIYGEVQRPKEYEYINGDSLSTLIKFAGGFLNSSYLDSVEFDSFIDNSSISAKQYLDLSSWRKQIDYESKLQGDFLLHPGDRVFIRETPDWLNAKRVVITGEVKFPGIYSINKEDSRVSDILERAGGFTSEASIEGAILIRQKEIAKNDREMERLRSIPYSEMSTNEKRYYQSRVSEQKGLMALDFRKILSNKNSDENIYVMDEDSIFVPYKKIYINVQGRVNNPGLVIYNTNYNYIDYINLAGGFGFRADESEALIVKSKGEQFLAKKMNYNIEPGDNILVPPQSETTFFEVFSTTLTVVAQIVTVLGVIIALRRL